MPRSAVLWSREAQADLSAIWDYYAAVAGRSAADQLVRDIARMIAVLEEHPHAGRARAEVREGLRSIAASPHVVFYRLRNDGVEIVRILDGRRDLDEIFASP